MGTKLWHKIQETMSNTRIKSGDQMVVKTPEQNAIRVGTEETPVVLLEKRPESYQRRLEVEENQMTIRHLDERKGRLTHMPLEHLVVAV